MPDRVAQVPFQATIERSPCMWSRAGSWETGGEVVILFREREPADAGGPIYRSTFNCDIITYKIAIGSGSTKGRRDFPRIDEDPLRLVSSSGKLAIFFVAIYDDNLRNLIYNQISCILNDLIRFIKTSHFFYNSAFWRRREIIIANNALENFIMWENFPFYFVVKKSQHIFTISTVHK